MKQAISIRAISRNSLFFALLAMILLSGVLGRAQNIEGILEVPEDLNNPSNRTYSGSLVNVTKILFRTLPVDATAGDQLFLTGTGERINSAFDNATNKVDSATIYLNASDTKKSWSIVTGNSPDWNGTLVIMEGNTLTVRNDSGRNPLGQWTDDKTSEQFAVVQVNTGATLNIASNTDIGNLTLAPAIFTTGSAVVNVDSSKRLTVHNGMTNMADFKKTGEGTMQVNSSPYNLFYNIEAAGGTLNIISNEENDTAFNVIKVNSGATMNVNVRPDLYDISFYSLNVDNGLFSLKSAKNGTSMIGSNLITVTELQVGSSGKLDVQTYGEIHASHLAVDANGIVNIYARMVKESNNTYTTENTHFFVDNLIQLKDDAVFNVIVANGTNVNSLGKMTILQTSTGTIDLGEFKDILVSDNVLGWDFVASFDSDEKPNEMYVRAQESHFLSDVALTSNARRVASYIENAERNNLYGSQMYNSLLALEDDPWATAQLTGEIYASAINYQFLSAYFTLQQVAEQMRSVPLVTYPGANTNQGQQNPAGASPNWNTGGHNTAPYGPGYAPAYEGQPMTQLESVFSEKVFRGQGGTTPAGSLIYSAWVTFLAGEGKNTIHNNELGYDSKRSGGILGLDLFCSTDCRSGIFYSYQKNDLLGLTEDLGKMNFQDNLLGLYHQFGDEYVYNLFTLRGGYSQAKTNRIINFSNGQVNDWFEGKTKSWQAGISAERGAHFQLGSAFIFSPYIGADYTFLYRDKLSETSTNGTGFNLVGAAHNFHSLHSTVGATAALRMYPCDQEIALLARGNWTHEFFDYMNGRQALSFGGFSGTGSFDVYGNNLGRDWALLGLGFEWAPVPELLLHVNWDSLYNKYTNEYFWAAGGAYRW